MLLREPLLTEGRQLDYAQALERAEALLERIAAK
jgi:hypothetical protein